jgi:Flp pilus assembly pilin Flp
MRLARLIRSDDGAAAAEYALLSALFGVVIALAAADLGNTIARAMGGVGERMTCGADC